MFGRVGFGGFISIAIVGLATASFGGPVVGSVAAAITWFMMYAYRKGREVETRQQRAAPPVSAHPPSTARASSILAAHPAPPPMPNNAPPERSRSYEWLNTGTSVDVQGRAIPATMIYFGKRLTSVASSAPDPSLIDPRLPVNHGWPDHAGSTMRYWPSYSDISPEARAAYLDWLATGRGNPSANIGYVFLFFYGLERRILHDATQTDAVHSELPALLAELQRLLAIYGSRSGSFYRYCTQLLDAIEVMFRNTPLYLTRPRAMANTGEFPTALRVALGQASVQGEPIPADWALAWYLSDPETRLRTPATRCPEELRELFRTRYAKQFAEGLIVKPNKTPLVVQYHPASRGFDSPLALRLPRLPDVAILSGPRKRIAAIADDCMDALDPYSRRVVQDPDRSLTTLALLPPELMTEFEHDGLRALREWTKRVTATDFTLAKGAELIALWSSKPGEAMSKKEAVGLAQLLDSMGIGIEPDVRFGGSPPRLDEPVVLFRQPEAHPAAPSPTYTAATLFLRLGAAVAIADGVLSLEEEDFLENHVAAVLHLTPAEKLRLRAHLKWLLNVEPTLTGLKKRIETLDAARRRAIAQFVVAAAGADGRIEPSEVKNLAKIYKQLGIAEAELHRELHNLSAVSPPATEPVTVRPAGKESSTFAIPAPPDKMTPATSAVQLDAGKIQAKLAETAQVSALLAGIFTEESAPAPAPARPAQVATVHGLDATLAQLLFAVQREAADSGALSRAQFETLCAGLSLMPDGALDKLNEAAFDKTDAPLLEGDELLELNHQAMKEMTA